jgi:8-oxo-dGTP diphosphatase
VNNLTNNFTFIPVVAAALIGHDGHVLMQRRRKEAMHGGLWEFPGGKLKPSETAEQALLREIEEELGILLDARDLVPLCFASDPDLPPRPRDPHVILLYTVRTWRGDPQCLAGEALGWFAPEQLGTLAMPPLDVPLAAALVRSI